MNNKKKRIFNKTFSKLFKLLGKSKGVITLAFLCAFISSLSAVFTTFYVGKALDCITGKNDVDFQVLYVFLFILLLLYAAFSLFQWGVSVLASKTAYRTVLELRTALFAKLSHLPISYFDTHPHGDIISRFTNDADSVGEALALTITGLFPGIVTVISALYVMLYMNVTITLIILIMTPVCFITAYFIVKHSQNTFKNQQEVVGRMSAFVSEVVGNQKTVQAFGYEQESITRFKALNNELFVAGKNAHFASALVNPSTRFVEHISYMLTGLVGGIISITYGLSAGAISSFLIYSAQFSKPFNEISSIMSNIQTALASLERIFSLLEESEDIADNVDALELTDINGDIKFENVAFSYNHSRPLISNLNFHVNSGDLIAIVGPTGAGKTTIVNLLMRFYEINSGIIFIDDVNITKIRRNSLRSNFGMVLQDTWLFSGSIRENIMYGNPNASEAEMIRASEAAYAHHFIKNLSDGYDTLITGNGDNLSEGQKQLITIARVMLADPRMLILDEATSSIDTLTEIRVQKALRKLMQGRTTFIIAHRLSTIVSADLILVLSNGKVVETGTHKQLLEQKGFYHELYYSKYE